jgi:hypothetical protein
MGRCCLVWWWHSRVVVSMMLLSQCWSWHYWGNVGHGVMSLPSRAGDGDAKSMFTVARCRCQVMPRGCHHRPSRCSHWLLTTEMPPLTVRVQPLTIEVPPLTLRVPPLTTINWSGIIDCQGAATVYRPSRCHHRLWGCSRRPSWLERLSLWDVMIMEATDLNVWIFTHAPRRAPTIIIYDNDLE